MPGLNLGELNWDTLEKNLGANIKMGGKKNYDDERFWKLSRDEQDNGGAIIRLLPDPTGTPFIQRYNHAFQSFDNVNKKKRWYINISPETIAQPCPASELWSALYSLGTDEGKKEAKKFARKIKYMCNIKVIKDPANPQNEGKIFLWEFGTKLKDKFVAALQPSASEIAMGEEPKELFNVMRGNNVKLKIAKVGGFLNYDATEIMGSSAVYDNIQEAETDILNNAYKLSEFTEPTAFETYEELKNKMKYVLESYNPEFVDLDTFKNVTNKVLDVSEPVSESVAQVTPEVQTPVVNQEPVKTTPEVQTETKLEPEPTVDDSNLDFLDNL